MEVSAFDCSIPVKVEAVFAVAIADSSLARFLQSRQRDFQKKGLSIVARTRASFS